MWVWEVPGLRGRPRLRAGGEAPVTGVPAAWLCVRLRRASGRTEGYGEALEGDVG